MPVLKDARFLLTEGLVAAAGTAAIATALLPLPVPWPVRLGIGAAGAMMAGLKLPALLRWVMKGTPDA